MKQEEWIHSILDSAGDIQPAEPNPFLYQKILHKMQKMGSEEVRAVKLRTSLAIAASLLIIINLAGLWTLKHKTGRQSEDTVITRLSNEISSGTTYNY